MVRFVAFARVALDTLRALADFPLRSARFCSLERFLPLAMIAPLARAPTLMTDPKTPGHVPTSRSTSY